MSSAHSVEAQHSEEITYIRANFQKAKGQLLSEFRLTEALTSRPPAAVSKATALLRSKPHAFSWDRTQVIDALAHGFNC